MVPRFKILKVFYHHNRGQFIFTHIVDGDRNFDVQEGSLLKGMAVYHYSAIPNKDDGDNDKDANLFVFRPISLSRFPDDYFIEGEVVELIAPD
jgi:hypothetical protein